MEYKEDIEQLFKNTFDNFEADVKPDAWVNIQKGLNVQPAADPVSVANNVSTAAKMTAVSSKLIVTAVTAIIGITAAVIYFSPGNENADSIPANESKIVQSDLPAAPSVETENKNISIAEDVKKEKYVGSSSEAIIGENEKIQSSKENSQYVSSTNEDIAVSSMNQKNAESVSEEKNKEADVKLQNNPAQASPLGVIDDKKTKENSVEKNEPADQSTEEDAGTTVPFVKEEKSIEEYLGQIPNVITPNSDGENDVFIIEGKDLKSLKVSISDRSGKIIHQWSNLHGFWDGKLENGQPAKTGTYFYNIFAQTNSGTPLTKQGSLHLLLK